MNNAHVHLGWYSRKKTGLHYYSPRRILGVLDRCGVDEFIVSSTRAVPFGAERVLLASCAGEVCAGVSVVRFDFAHCCPMDEMLAAVVACPNVWTDTAFMDASELRELPRYDWQDRLMFGSDLPVWQAHEAAPLPSRLLSCLAAFCATGLERESDSAFAEFVQN